MGWWVVAFIENVASVDRGLSPILSIPIQRQDNINAKSFRIWKILAILLFFPACASAVPTWVWQYDGESYASESAEQTCHNRLIEAGVDALYDGHETREWPGHSFDGWRKCYAHKISTNSWAFHMYIINIGDVVCQPGYTYDGVTGSCVIPTVAPLKNVGKAESCQDQALVGNPINAGMGNKFQEEVDYHASGSEKLGFIRYYNSHVLVGGGAFGDKWSASFLSDLEVIGDPLTATTVNARSASGQVLSFTFNGDWRPDVDVNNNLERLTDTSGNFIGWRYTRNDGVVEIYSTTGKLLSITNRNGLTQTLIYDGQNRLYQVTNSFGQTLTFAYDAQNRIQSMTDPEGGIYTYGYDANNNLTSVTYPDNKTRTYLYEDINFSHALTGIIDENNNRFATWAYDTQGRAISSEHAGGVEKVDLVYNTDGTTTVTDALGTARTYTFQTILGVVKNASLTQPCSSCGGSNQATTYDTNGNVASKTDFNGTVTTYTYDLARNLETARTEAYGTASARTISTQWHPTFRIPTAIAEPLKLTTYTHDANGNVLTKTEQATTDTNGSQGFTATPVGSPRVSSYTYNTFGQVLTANGPRTDVNDVTTYTYDAQGNIATVTNALGHLTQITNYDASGRPLRIVDPNGLVTTLTYSPRGWLTSRNVGGEITSFQYDGVGQLLSVTLPDNSVINYTYDAAHRLTDIQEAAGNRIHYTLDLMGNRTREDVYNATNTLTQTRSRVFDALSRLAQSLGAQNQTTAYQYDANGNVTQITDPATHVTNNGYDALNRLTQVTDALNGVTRYGYNAQDQLTTVTDPRGNITSYSYDGLGNLTQQISPDTGATAFGYDAAGNLISQTDAKNQTTTYQYDALNRLTQATYSDATTTVYHYDQGANTIGRLTSITDPSGSTSYQYDAHGRVTQKTQTTNNVSLSVAYRYNAQGQLDQISYPSSVIGISYSNGQPGSLSLNGQPLLGNISYLPFGPVTGWRWGNSTTDVSRQYDLDGQLTSYTLANATQQLNYANTGNLTTITEPGNAANDQSFSYDALSRLATANGAYGAQSYGYDANGNRNSTTLNGINNSYTNAATSNRLQSITGAVAKSYSYDANGNVINDGLMTYTYDARNRLTSLNTGVSYAINGLGQRISKTIAGIDTTNTTAGDANGDGSINAQDYSAIVSHILGTPASNDADCNQDSQVNVQDLVCINIKINPALQTAGGKTLFVYDEQGQLIGEYDQTGAVIQETIYLGNLPVAVVKNNVVYRLYADHLNTPREIADTTNKVVWRWNSDAFGTTAANEDPDNDGIKFTYNLRFPGQYFDQETGLHYNYFRDYDPTTGRYVESDPIGLEGGLNTYLYVKNNPINLVDPSGLAPRSLPFPVPGKCETEEECWKKAEKQLYKCQAIWSPAKKYLCVQQWRHYQLACPGLTPAPSCKNKCKE